MEPSAIISLACSAGCCLSTGLIMVAVIAFFVMRMRGGDDDLDMSSGAGPALENKPDIPSVPSASQEGVAVIGGGQPDLFDDEEMATVVAPPPPGLVNDVPSAPPPPPPAGGGAQKASAPPPPPRSSGQTIIAFDDDDEDW